MKKTQNHHPHPKKKCLYYTWTTPTHPQKIDDVIIQRSLTFRILNPLFPSEHQAAAALVRIILGNMTSMIHDRNISQISLSTPLISNTATSHNTSSAMHVLPYPDQLCAPRSSIWASTGYPTCSGCWGQTSAWLCLCLGGWRGARGQKNQTHSYSWTQG